MVTRTPALTLAARIVAEYFTSEACPAGTNVVVYTELLDPSVRDELVSSCEGLAAEVIALRAQ